MFEDSQIIYGAALNLQNFCESSADKKFNKEIFSVKFKILYLVFSYNQISPSTLVNSLNMAKSNIALFCKQLIKEQFIITKQDQFDHRVIYYCLTKKGQKHVLENLEKLDKMMQNSFSQTGLKNISRSAKTISQYLLKTGVKQ